MNNSFQVRHIFPKLHLFMGVGRNVYGKIKCIQSKFMKRHLVSSVIPDCYQVCNTNTINSDMTLNVLTGELPKNIEGNLYICQCLGTPGAFMVGDTNLVKVSFSQEQVTLKNRFMWNPVAIARMALKETKYRFRYYGLLFLSPGVGIYSYTEGMYLMPDGRLGITSDVDRPWLVDRERLRVETSLGTRKEWMSMMTGSVADVMGKLFAGYSNSHAVYTDTETNELFLVNYQYEAVNKEHPCQLMRWDGKNQLEKWFVVDENGVNINIVQSIHELIFTRDYILLADTSFVAGMEMLTPWENAPLPNKNTVVYIVDRRHMLEGVEKVSSKKVTIEEACIHLIADYENPEDKITVYMLHTPATNTAEIIKDYDVDMNGVLFPKHLVGYGTLPVLDLSSVGKHIIDMKQGKVESSDYITDDKYCWGPYMYTYMGRQTRKFQEQDLYIMFKGFSKDMLPKRIYDAYKEVDNRRFPLEKMVDGDGLQCNNSIARIEKGEFKIVDAYTFPDKVLLYTVACLESNTQEHPGYVIAGVVHDVLENDKSSGHEYWLFHANELQKGPICTLGNKQLNNSVLFHTVYINKELEQRLDQKKVTYQVPIRCDYPKSELDLWGSKMYNSFEEVIYPYYEKAESHNKRCAEARLEEFTTKRICEHAGSEHLIEEVPITNAHDHAQRMIEEANRMFQTTGWEIESNEKGLLVESKPVSGVFASADICVVRACGMIPVEAKVFFAYMSSPKGYAVIDPVSDPDDHEKEPLQVYEWRENCRLEAALATTKIPGMKPADFVVLNAIDPEEMIFASKSILHDTMPGGSKYSKAGPPTNGRERAINTFVIKIVPINKEKCQVLCINYADMAGNTSAKMNNFINKKAFFKPLYNRMQKAAKEINRLSTH